MGCFAYVKEMCSKCIATSLYSALVEETSLYQRTMDNIDVLSPQRVLPSRGFDINQLATLASTNDIRHDRYAVTEIVLQQLEIKFRTISLGNTNNNYNFIRNHRHKTAVAPILFGQKLLTGNAGDRAKRTRTAGCASYAARKFLNTFPDYTLAIALGTTTHELCIFICRAKDTKVYNVMIFNPTPNIAHVPLRKFICDLGRKVAVHGYNHPARNVEVWCGVYVWQEIYKFMTADIDVFGSRENYAILQYSRRTGRLEWNLYYMIVLSYVMLMTHNHKYTSFHMLYSNMSCNELSIKTPKVYNKHTDKFFISIFFCIEFFFSVQRGRSNTSAHVHKYRKSRLCTFRTICEQGQVEGPRT